MRHSGDWMTLVDDRILEYLRENETGSPTEMKEEGPINYSSPYIGRRAKRLAEEGLTRHLGNAVYTITDDGEAYLDGRLDTQEWRYIDDDASEVTASNSEEVPGESNGGAT
ncbi:phage repressor protein [Halorubrum sp. SS5]|nr:phage repressor protein [Halorubrum sp. SS5]